MQIMPVTARHFKIDQRRLSDPEVNITLAAKLIKSIDESLGFAEGTPDESRLSIILAAYNCGIGQSGMPAGSPGPKGRIPIRGRLCRAASP